MTDIRPRQLARIGMFYLEEAILDVLLEAIYGADESWVSPLRISKRADVYYEEERLWKNFRYAVVKGILSKLESEGRVECKIGKSGKVFRLTDAERDRRRDDVMN